MHNLMLEMHIKGLVHPKMIIFCHLLTFMCISWLLTVEDKRTFWSM